MPHKPLCLHELKTLPSLAINNRIMKDAKRLYNMSLTHNINMKEAHTVVAPRLEDALLRWLCTQNNKGVIMNGGLLNRYSKDVLDETNKLLPTSDKLNLTFFND